MQCLGSADPSILCASDSCNAYSYSCTYSYDTMFYTIYMPARNLSLLWYQNCNTLTRMSLTVTPELGCHQLTVLLYYYTTSLASIFFFLLSYMCGSLHNVYRLSYQIQNIHTSFKIQVSPKLKVTAHISYALIQFTSCEGWGTLSRSRPARVLCCAP